MLVTLVFCAQVTCVSPNWIVNDMQQTTTACASSAREIAAEWLRDNPDHEFVSFHCRQRSIGRTKLLSRP
jgi:hypothetical protein